MQATMTRPGASERFRPVLHSVDKLPSGAFECEVLLVPDVGGQWQNVPDQVAALLTAIRVTIRFRHEVIEPFSGQIEQLKRRYGPLETRDRLRMAFYSILKEAESRGLLDRQLISGAFEASDERATIDSMFDQWISIKQRVFNAIGMSPSDEVWTEFTDEPIGDDNIQVINQSLAELKEMNSRFLVMASRQYAAIVERMYV